VRLGALDVVHTGGPAAASAPVDEAAGKVAPVEEPAAPVREQTNGRLSDETVLGYTDVDLGLTIAPHTDGLPVVAGGEATDVAEPGPEPAEDVVPGEDPADEFQPDESVDSPAAAEASQAPAAAEASQTPAAAEASEDSGGVPVHTSTTDPLVPTLETTTNYDHLWDKTVMRNIEDAAVRVVGDEDEHDVPAVQVPAPPMPPEASPPTQKPAEAKNDEAPPAPVGVPALIDSVPWLRSAGPSAEAAEPAPVQQFTPPASEAPAFNTPASEAPASMVDDPDHDGQTVMKSSVAADVPEPKAGAGPGSAAGRSGTGGQASGPSVLARVCGQGHANPPTYPQCASCGLALSGDAVQVPRPRLGRMRISTGELIDLDQSLIIGRQPSVSRVQGGTMPRLVQVESPGGDISRSHVEVRLEGWHVMLCDLKATNGTVLIREGQAPRRLAQNEMAILLDGDIAELGDNVSLRFEEIL
jgi:hypothetical protein